MKVLTYYFLDVLNNPDLPDLRTTHEAARCGDG